VLIAHVAAHTRSIRLGAGGVMLPNHAPLVIAEQYGTLAVLHPGRIDLGLGRAPGTDQATLRALRVDPMEAEEFPQDVVELQGYLGDETLVDGVHATPGKGTHVPLYVLGRRCRRTARGAAGVAVRVRVALRSGGARAGGRGVPARPFGPRSRRARRT